MKEKEKITITPSIQVSIATMTIMTTATKHPKALTKRLIKKDRENLFQQF